MYSLGKKIEALRKETGTTQEELAEKLGVTRQSVSQWENDISSPKADKFKLLCQYFKVKPEYFLFEEISANRYGDKEDLSIAEGNPVKQAEQKSKKYSRGKIALITCGIVLGIPIVALLVFFSIIFGLYYE